MKKLKLILVGMGILMCSMFANLQQAGALTLTIPLTEEFSGPGYNPAGSAPWLTATFSDLAGGNVLLSMQSNLQGAGEFVAIWFFNYEGQFPLVFTYLDDATYNSTGPAAVAPNPQKDAVEVDVDGLKADGGGYFDFAFNFPQGANSDRFTGSEVVYYMISGSSGASYFDAFSVNNGSKPAFTSAAHVQGINIPGAIYRSGFIAGDPRTVVTPEPGTMILLGSGLLGLGLLRRRKPRQK